jgi:hypothetical protein
MVLFQLAADLKERGGIDVSECFVDGTFAPAKSSNKKGALPLARPSEARGPRSWQLQTALVFLSPYAQPVTERPALARMKSSS